MVRRFDIVMVTDTRLPGGTSASVAEEIRAQAAAGYRTAVLHVESSLVRQAQRMSPRLRAGLERGDFTLLLGSEPVEADVVVLRHPTVAGDIDPLQTPLLSAARRLLVVNQAPSSADVSTGGLGAGMTRHYDPVRVARHLEDWFGARVDWAPIGPLVRANLQAVAPELPLLDEDWVNVIDVNAWRVNRSAPARRRPTIGRHSRDHPMKWPATRERILEVYPDSPEFDVRLLGGDQHVREVFGGRLPANWTAYPFGSMPPDRFLAGIDYYVYYHHPALVEAFGRSILEAMASGAPTILPEHFRELFDDAPVYARPSEVVDKIRALHDDSNAYRAVSQRSVDFVEQHFGHQAHVRRLAALAEASGQTAERVTPSTAARVSDGPRKRVLFVSSNGAGVGHLMRLMAMARHAGNDVDPLFLTFSQAVKVVDDAGYFVEYLASRSMSGATAVQWHPMLKDRILELIARYRVDAVVFDGTWPYQGLLDAVAESAQVRLVWSRRAMWKPGVSNPVLDDETGRFDLVIEPGEAAGDDDQGATRIHRGDATRVGPITFLSEDELLDREAARAELGIDPDRPAALIQLGAGNINDAASELGMVVERLAREPDVEVRVVQSIIAQRAADLPANIQSISIYPLARYLKAFDFAVAASGYNSYHELLAAGVPTAFIPNLHTATDDQAGRSRYADRMGFGIDLAEPTPARVDEAITRLLDTEFRQRMREQALAQRPANGAPVAMEAITAAIESSTEPAAEAAPTPALGPSIDSSVDSAAEMDTQPSQIAPGEVAAPGPDESRLPVPAAAQPSAVQRVRGVVRTILGPAKSGDFRRMASRAFYSLPPRVRKRLRPIVRRLRNQPAGAVADPNAPLPVPPGNALSATAPEPDTVIAFVLPEGITADAVADIVDHIAQLQVALLDFAPLFITRQPDFAAFRRYGYLFEYVPPLDRWSRLTAYASIEDAVAQRIRSILQIFGVGSVITIPDPADTAPWEVNRQLSSYVTGIIEAKPRRRRR